MNIKLYRDIVNGTPEGIKLGAKLWDDAVQDKWSTQPNVLDPRFKYTNAMNTDIRKTWEKYGWKPSTKNVRG